jgi:hypothetical protein
MAANCEVCVEQQTYPLRELAEKFWPDYGWGPADFDPRELPECLDHSVLIQQGAARLAVLLPEQVAWFSAWGKSSVEFAQQFGPRAACGMRQVFAATSWEVNEPTFLRGKPTAEKLGTVTVCGVNGLPPDHINYTLFTPEETAVAVHRILMHLFKQGKLADESAFQAASAKVADQIEGKILDCIQIADLLADLLGEEIHYCRRRTAGSLPKSACPSILCAEGDSLANQPLGEMAWLLLAEPGFADLTVMPQASFSTLSATQEHPLLPAEYRIPYRLQSAGGVKEGTIYMSLYSVLQLTRAGVPGLNVDLRQVRQTLQPTHAQTNIQIGVVGGAEPGYFDHEIYFFNPADPENRTETYRVDPYDFQHSWRFGYPNWQGGADPGEHYLQFRTQAQVTSDVPCPRCTKTILQKAIPLVVVNGKMSLKPTYYEAADLFRLLGEGVVVINDEFRMAPSA